MKSFLSLCLILFVWNTFSSCFFTFYNLLQVSFSKNFQQFSKLLNFMPFYWVAMINDYFFVLNFKKNIAKLQFNSKPLLKNFNIASTAILKLYIVGLQSRFLYGSFKLLLFSFLMNFFWVLQTKSCFILAFDYKVKH